MKMPVVYKSISNLRFFLIFTFLFILYLIVGYHKKDSFNRFNKVIVFGDSFSYTGDYDAKKLLSPSPITHRYQGRYCDSLVWIERLGVLEKFSYAVPGATSDNDFLPSIKHIQGTPVPSVREQIATYLENTPKNNFDSTKSLYIIWIGFNDYYRNRSIHPRRIVKSIMNAIQDLLVRGATNFLIFNQPPLQAFPCYRIFNESMFYTQLTYLFNTEFTKSLAVLQKNHPKISIHMFDFYTLLTRIIANNSSSTFTNTVDPCWIFIKTGIIKKHCPDPKKYVFVDAVHFSSSVHQLIADAIQPFLSYDFRKNTPDSYIYSF